MKHGILTITLTLLAGLLITSQALAGGQGKQMGSGMSDATQSGMQTQGQMKTMDQMQNQQQATDRKLNREQVREMQRLLNHEGYAIRNINGLLDTETTTAIRSYQQSEKLSTTGMPNQETLRALAPNPDQQEFFGLSPEFGETNY